MTAAMAKLTCQNQELTWEINQRRQCHRWCVEGQAQSQEARKGENVEREDHSRGTVSHRVPHLEKKMDQMRRAMDEMKENMRRTNHVDDLIHQINSPFIKFINSHPCLLSSRCLRWTYMMEHVTHVITLLP